MHALRRALGEGKLGFTPADGSAAKFWTLDPTLMARVGVTIILSDGALPGSLARLPLALRRGRFEVHELAPMSRVESLAPWARVDVLAWENDVVSSALRMAPAQSLFACRDVFSGVGCLSGRKADPVREEQFGGSFIALQVEPGLVELRFHHSLLERVCVWISLGCLLAVLGMGAAIAARRPNRSTVGAVDSLARTE